jgi:hypothetical protein
MFGPSPTCAERDVDPLAEAWDYPARKDLNKLRERSEGIAF